VGWLEVDKIRLGHETVDSQSGNRFRGVH